MSKPFAPESLRPGRRARSFSSRSRRPSTGAALLLMLATSLLLSVPACSRKPSGAPDATPPPGSAAAAPGAEQAPADPNVVQAPETLMRQLKLAKVQLQPVADRVSVPGRIDFDAQRVARLGAAVSGRVLALEAIVGQQVKPGETLARLNSVELGAARLSFAKALAQLKLQRRAVERARLLLASDVIGRAELQRRESELGVSEAELSNAAEQLRLMGMSASDVERLRREQRVENVATVASTLDGVVVERLVNQGQVVQPSDPMFTVADMSHVWAVALVPESEAASVRVGQTVRVEVPALESTEPIQGQLIWVSDLVDRQTRMVDVRSDIANPERTLKAGMLVNMVIEGATRSRLAVPASAVVRENNANHVFVRTEASTFRLTPVQLGEERGELRLVTGGLEEGREIIVDGAFHLNNERKRAELEAS